MPTAGRFSPLDVCVDANRDLLAIDCAFSHLVAVAGRHHQRLTTGRRNGLGIHRHPDHQIRTINGHSQRSGRSSHRHFPLQGFSSEQQVDRAEGIQFGKFAGEKQPAHGAKGEKPVVFESKNYAMLRAIAALTAARYYTLLTPFVVSCYQIIYVMFQPKRAGFL